MLQLFMDKQFIPVAASVLTLFLILLTRPGFLVRSSDNKDCPYCLNSVTVSLLVLLVGGVSYVLVNQDADKLKLELY